MRRVAIDAQRPDTTVLLDAAAIVRAGGIVAMPTDTLYGLAADPFSIAAVERVFAAKGRASERSIALVAADVVQIEEQLGALAPDALRLAVVYWPGPLTILVPRPSSMPDLVTGGLPHVGVRVPGHAVARELCRAAGRVLTATSANPSGTPATDDPDVVEQTMSEHVELLLDAGTTPGGPPSTIVDVTEPAPRLVRAGAIPWDEVLACLGRG